jgi:hypothetical protein
MASPSAVPASCTRTQARPALSCVSRSLPSLTIHRNAGVLSMSLAKSWICVRTAMSSGAGAFVRSNRPRRFIHTGRAAVSEMPSRCSAISRAPTRSTAYDSSMAAGVVISMAQASLAMARCAASTSAFEGSTKPKRSPAGSAPANACHAAASGARCGS